MLTQRLRGPAGSHLVVKQDHTYPLIGVTACFLGGQCWESLANDGITRLVQRMRLRGTRTRSADQFAEGLEFLGVPMGTFSTKDFYGLSMSVLSRHLSPALELMAECLEEPAFSADEVQREKTSQLLEQSRREKDRIAFALEAVETLLFDDHPYARSGYGTPESLAVQGPQQLHQWHHRMLAPERFFLSVAGDVNPENLLREVERRFCWLSSSQVPKVSAALSPRFGRLEFQLGRLGAIVVIALLGPSWSSPDYGAFELLHAVLGGAGGRLIQRLRHLKGLGYLVNCRLERRLQRSCLKAYLATGVERLEEARTGLLGELRELADQPISRQELYQAKRAMLGMCEVKMQKKAFLAEQLAKFEAAGLGFESFERYAEPVRALQSEDVQRAAQQALEQGFVEVTVLPVS